MCDRVSTCAHTVPLRSACTGCARHTGTKEYAREWARTRLDMPQAHAGAGVCVARALPGWGQGCCPPSVPPPFCGRGAWMPLGPGQCRAQVSSEMMQAGGASVPRAAENNISRCWALLGGTQGCPGAWGTGSLHVGVRAGCLGSPWAQLWKPHVGRPAPVGSGLAASQLPRGGALPGTAQSP